MLGSQMTGAATSARKIGDPGDRRARDL